MLGRTGLIAVVALALPLGACASRRAPIAEAPPPAAAGEDAEGLCPMRVPGARVDVMDTPEGAVLTFTTDRGDAGELRNRTRRMAQMHNVHAARSVGTGVGEAPAPPMVNERPRGQMSPMMMITMTPAQARVEDVAGGARVVLIAMDPAQRDALRAEARQRADRMRAGECPRMGGM